MVANEGAPGPLAHGAPPLGGRCLLQDLPQPWPPVGEPGAPWCTNSPISFSPGTAWSNRIHAGTATNRLQNGCSLTLVTGLEPTQVGAGWPLATPGLSGDTPPRLIDKLIETTKRVCINLDTLQRPNSIEVIVVSARAR